MALLCLQCRREFPPAEYSGCPGCGDTQGVPADTEDKVTITITRHELRILTIWAERWATSMKDEKMREHARRTVYGICDALELQAPSETALTMAGEIKQLQSRFPGTATNFPEPPGPAKEPE